MVACIETYLFRRTGPSYGLLMKPLAQHDKLESESHSSIDSMIVSDRPVGGIDIIKRDGGARTKGHGRFFCCVAEVAEVSSRSRLWRGVMQWLQLDKAQDEYCKARNPNPNNTGDAFASRSSEANLLHDPTEITRSPNPNRAAEVEENPNGYNTEDADRKPNQNNTESAPRNPNLSNSEETAVGATSEENSLFEPLNRGGNPKNDNTEEAAQNPNPNNDNNTEDAAQNPNLNNTENAEANPAGNNKTQEATRNPKDSRTRSRRERKTLVLDLDETLVHSSFKAIARYDFEMKVEMDGKLQSVFVVKRPGVDRFLQAMAREFEVVVFTAGLEKYADPLLDRLDPRRLISRRLYRGSCIQLAGGLVKDLALLGKDLRHVIIVDNSPHSYLLHPDNAVPVSSFVNNPRDRELLELIPFLSSLAKLDNVTHALRKRRSAT